MISVQLNLEKLVNGGGALKAYRDNYMELIITADQIVLSKRHYIYHSYIWYVL